MHIKFSFGTFFMRLKKCFSDFSKSKIIKKKNLIVHLRFREQDRKKELKTSWFDFDSMFCEDTA